MIAQLHVMCVNANQILEDWYDELQKFLTISKRVSRFMTDLENLTDVGTPHRQRCQALGFPVDEGIWTPEVPLPSGFVYETFEPYGGRALDARIPHLLPREGARSPLVKSQEPRERDHDQSLPERLIRPSKSNDA